MFSIAKLAVVAAAYGTLASATLTTTISAQPPAATTISQCNTGAAYCCNQAGSVQSLLTPLDTLLNTLGVDIIFSDINTVIGLTCTPILSIAPTCSANPVCCTDNDFAPGLTIACNSITL